MAFTFKGFRATRPCVRTLNAMRGTYQVFFIIYPLNSPRRQFRYSDGINEEKSIRLRKQDAEACAETLWEALQNGWNPLEKKFPAFQKHLDEFTTYTFSAALDFSLKKKKEVLSKYSFYDYEGCARFMKKAAKECGMDGQLITSFKRKDIRLIVATAKELNEWSNKARNKYLSLLKSLLSVLVDEELLEVSPAHRIKNEPEEKTEGFKRLTDMEKQRVYDHLIKAAPEYFEYLMFIYQRGVRRKETLLIEVRDIDITRQRITIRPEVAKTNRERVVPITHEIMQILMNREVWNLPPNWKLFSNNKFKPGPTSYHPNIPTTWWRNLVQKQLGITCKMYSLKHRGADDMIMADLPLEALKKLYGHRSILMTETYARAVKEKYEQQLIDKAPSFAAKVIPMKKAE